MMNKLALSILISIILTAIIISTVNVGISLILNQPDYPDFCDYSKEMKIMEVSGNITKEICEENQGVWIPPDIQCVKAPCVQGYCDFYQKCQQQFENSMKSFNQLRFYILAGLGFILLIVGLFALENLIQITGLATGGILVIEGIIMNLQNKLIVFISLLAILVIFGILAWKVIHKKEDSSRKKKNNKRKKKK